MHLVEENRQATVYGVRPTRIFKEAATKHLLESQKSSLKDDALQLKTLGAYIGDLSLDLVHMGTLQNFIQTRQKEGVKNRTINYALQTVRHILNLAATEWRDEYDLTWLVSAQNQIATPKRCKRFIHFLGMSKISCSMSCLSIYSVWRSLRLIRGVESGKSAACAGNGKFVFQSLTPAFLLSRLMQ